MLQILLQQSAGDPQESPRAPQVGRGAQIWPTQISEQQSAGLEHGMATIAQMLGEPPLAAATVDVLPPLAVPPMDRVELLDPPFPVAGPPAAEVPEPMVPPEVAPTVDELPAVPPPLELDGPSATATS